jgi:hypothetical protein
MHGEQEHHAGGGIHPEHEGNEKDDAELAA